MDSVLMDVNWTAIITGAAVAYVLGALWYSPTMFGNQWMKAVGIPKNDKTPMAHAMITQGFGTFFLSWLVGIAAATNSLQLAALVAFTAAALIKANGLFAMKKMIAIKIEVGFVLAMVVVMVLAHAVI